MPRKLCGWATDCRALTATSRLPSVPFLKPTGQERPEDISRWVWDSVVRAPMADQLMQSWMYWGEMGSRSEERRVGEECGGRRGRGGAPEGEDCRGGLAS